MGDHNSLSVYTQILERLVIDIAYSICLHPSELRRELTKMRSRCRAEGISFFTKTLATFGKAFDKALQGEVAFTPAGFQKKPGKSTPYLLWWLIERVFDDDGYVRSDADVGAIKHVRQITQLLYKLELPSNEADTEKVLASFVAVNEELSKLRIDPRDAVIKRARVFITRVLSGLSSRDIIPGHGPGAVATGERGGEKSTFSRLYKDLEAWYPFTEYFHVSLSHTADHMHKLEALEELETGTAKVVLVPKDSRGPRLISCEPLEKQWIQQGQRKALYSHIENHRLTAGQVNFTNQHINRELALLGSKSQEYVTLDMKEASDRVSLQLVEQLFCGTEWYSALIASRSGYTRLPNGTTVKLETFAPMGSAVCFPVEALTFWALAVATLNVHHKVDWRVACQQVWVYGDDIICRREVYPTIMQNLERFGLLFNRSKCCVSGFYRESCGCDAYKGFDITPIRLRKTWNHRSSYDVVQLQSYVEFSNSMYQRGYRGTALYVEGLVRSLYKLPIPYLEYRSLPTYYLDECLGQIRKCVYPNDALKVPPGRVIGFSRPDVNPSPINQALGVRTRFNRDLHYQEVYGYAAEPTYDTWEFDAWETFLRSLTCGPTGGRTGLQHGRYAVSHRSRMKRTWGPIR